MKERNLVKSDKRFRTRLRHSQIGKLKIPLADWSQSLYEVYS